MGLEVFKASRTRVGLEQFGAPVVKIAGGSKRMLLSLYALSELNAEEGGDVVLFFDRATGHVGLRAAKGSDTTSSCLRVLTRKLNANGAPVGSPSIGIAGFEKAFKIDLKLASGVFRLGSDETTGLLVFKLPDGSWEKQLLAPPRWTAS